MWNEENGFCFQCNGHINAHITNTQCYVMLVFAMPATSLQMCMQLIHTHYTKHTLKNVLSGM